MDPQFDLLFPVYCLFELKFGFIGHRRRIESYESHQNARKAFLESHATRLILGQVRWECGGV